MPTKKFWIMCSLMLVNHLSGFHTESLVLTDAPREFELVTFKAESNLKFTHDLDEAIKQACLDNKSVLLFVVGDAQCPWSEKLMLDVVYKPEFYLKAQKNFILCKVEINNLKANGSELGIDHPLEQIPLMLCLTKEGKVISEKLDIPDSPSLVINYLDHVLEASHKIDAALAQSKSMSDEELETSYKTAKDLGLKSENNLFTLGSLKKKNIFFMLEKYQKLLVHGTTKELKDLKLDIQRLDPRNSKGAIRTMALMDFEDRSRQKKGMDNPFSALKPLFEYLRDYGHYDKDHRWEIEMKIARFLFSKNQIQAALQHASRSLEFAPEGKKTEVQDAVTFLKKQKEAQAR